MYRIDPHTGLADGARQCASPNCDARPAGMVPELIIIHNISLPPGKFGGSRIDEFFCNRLDVADDPYFAEIADMQ
ncbi:MAG: 1,6-anhydro-N-acetylmuramyl-L-alanine amidase AmpD, partial [Gammaproteobacteria bacterium]|nr:1,6-anhydro-N-acetylmuramyl-L-alanine amidase AmpD [Gammaproteobacteria bacterium]